MELETIRIVADWLNGITAPANGVNALLATTPRDAGDPVPPAVTVYDATRDDWVSRKTIPKDAAITVPAVAVLLTGTPTLDGEVETVVRTGKFTVLIQYVADQSDAAGMMRDALYTKRTILRSLKQLHDPVNAATARLRNNVILRVCESINLDPTVEPAHDKWLTTQLVLNYTVRDIAP